MKRWWFVILLCCMLFAPPIFVYATCAGYQWQGNASTCSQGAVFAQGMVSPVFATNTPVAQPSVSPTSTPSAGLLLYVPVVAFPSLETSLSANELSEIVRGAYHARLIVDTTTFQVLSAMGIALHPNTQVVSGDALETALWDNRDLFALVPFEQLTLQMRVLWIDDHPIFGDLSAYPLAFVSDNPNFYLDRFSRITLSGVTAIARGTQVALDDHTIVEAVSGIQSYTQQSDLFHMSNEVSFADPCPNLMASDLLGGSSSLCTKIAHFDILKMLGVDVIELTGNHNNDYGYDDYLTTFAWYKDQGILTVGGGLTPDEASRPLILTVNGTRIGWIACNFVGPYYALANDDPLMAGGISPGAMPCEWDWFAETIPVLKAQVDVVIVSVQQVEVDDYLPLDSQRVDFRKLIDLGADFVAGTASHKPQVFEFYGDGIIHYGLGNLFFDQTFWGNMRFFMDTLLVYDGQVRSLEIFPGLIEDSYRPRLMTADERKNFLFFMFREQNGF